MTKDRITPPSLEALRQEIDEIDGEIHRLIKRRADVVETLGALKKAGGSTQALRPGREAQVLRRLIRTHNGPFPAVALLGLWRTMMAAFLRMQQPLEIRVAGKDLELWDVARIHFGAETPIACAADSDDAVAEVRAADGIAAVVPAPADNDGWWRQLSEGGVMVAAKLPIFSRPGTNGPGAFLVARARPEPSGDDVTLLRFSGPGPALDQIIAKAAADAGLELSPIAAYNPPEPQAPASRLMAVDRYLDAEDDALARLGSGGVEVERVGCFARPIVLPDEA